jgi:hypothetical protein
MQYKSSIGFNWHALRRSRRSPGHHPRQALGSSQLGQHLSTAVQRQYKGGTQAVQYLSGSTRRSRRSSGHHPRQALGSSQLGQHLSTATHRQYKCSTKAVSSNTTAVQKQYRASLARPAAALHTASAASSLPSSHNIPERPNIAVLTKYHVQN